MQNYILINSLQVHDGPIRCLSKGINPNELLTGCQSNSPCVRRWKFSDDFLKLEEIGSPIYHDHWVTAITALTPDPSRSIYPEGCFISGCMDSKIRIFDHNNILVNTLEGHSKGVISFSWLLNSSFLISGSWDGTALLWNLEQGSPIQQFGPHENGVHVLGLTNGLIASTSTGESVDGKPANFQIRFWDSSTGKEVSSPIRDHEGSIRSITALPGVEGFLTTANDGTVVMRSIEGQVIASLQHPLLDESSSPFIFDCCALNTQTGMDFVSVAEDGTVAVWIGSELFQSINHPSSVWTVCALPSNQVIEGSFCTGGNDGWLRIFSNSNIHRNNIALEQLNSSFVEEVRVTLQSRNSGPTAEDLAKAPKWEERHLTPGKKENDIMVFNQNDQLIAAEWVSGSWVIIGQVTGSSNGGEVNGVHFDHVLPAELETPTGLKSFKLGYNNGENPFVAAQRFIDQNELNQNYLQQIADWIITQTGQSNTIGTPGAPTAIKPQQQLPETPPPIITPPMPIRSKFLTNSCNFPVFADSYIVFDDLPTNGTKIIAKLQELNDKSHPNVQLLPSEIQQISSVLSVLTQPSYFHSSVITAKDIESILLLGKKWHSTPETMANLFIFYDLLRMLILHPMTSSVLNKFPSHLITIQGLIQHLLMYIQSLQVNLPPYTVWMTLLRFMSNLYASIQLQPTLMALSNIKSINEALVLTNLQLVSYLKFPAISQVYLSNKQVRIALVSMLYNYLFYLADRQALTSEDSSIPEVFACVFQLLQNEQETILVMYRGVQILSSLVSLLSCNLKFWNDQGQLTGSLQTLITLCESPDHKLASETSMSTQILPTLRQLLHVVFTSQ